ncbi:MAG: aminodeoxychorismate synthase component I [Bacteroidota bacterium]
MRKDTIINQMNEYGKLGIPFVFIVDFLMKSPLLFTLDQIPSDEIWFDFNGFSNINKPDLALKELQFSKFPIPFSDYAVVFDKIMQQLRYGNSYLLNLTFETPIKTNYSQEELFLESQAKYKMFWKDHFVVFSPEIFIKINGHTISSFPMKGTIDAAIPNAESVLKSDKKEFAEHCTIVDLIRNDLSMVAKNVKVRRFAYADYIKTHHKTLIQLSSEIEGTLPLDFKAHLGDILFTLLPAGSVSGAPKRKTVEIICENEPSQRGYYTGVMGCFDGQNLDSAVMIRYIDVSDEIWHYKSGGGITINSNCLKEYNEMIDKVYVPII